MRIGAPRDFVSGLLFIVIGAAGMWLGRNYAVGSVVRMGPGYLPMVLSGGTILIGLAVLLRSLGTKGPRIEWGVLRPILLIAAALTVFSLLISDFGMVVAIVATVLIASPATPEFRPVEVLLALVLMPIFCAVVFVLLLGQPVPIWPVW